MELPPVTPRGVINKLRERPDVGLTFARWWMILGAFVALFALAFGIAHFAYDMPVVDRNSGRILSSREVLPFVALLGGGGVLFLTMGTVLRRWLRNQ